ncbi:hypothetical protein [Rodentibacter caecimuris]|nr:hypothetical protein [Rodentibacter heylii]
MSQFLTALFALFIFSFHYNHKTMVDKRAVVGSPLCTETTGIEPDEF